MGAGRQPTAGSSAVQFKMLLAGARNLDALDPVPLARSYGLGLREVEYHLGVERRRRQPGIS